MTTKARGNNSASDLPKLAAPARRALAGAGLANLAQVAGQREADVAALHGMGPNAMAALRAAMKVKGLGFLK
jgi:predicted Fe-Mo cluster-binding NifX family protein